jgi:predicted nucleotidyltransferase
MQNHNEAENRHIAVLKGEIIAFFEDEDVKVILFGSRARGDNHPAADVDIGIIPSGELDNTKIALLNEKIEDLNIPYKVEVVNFAQVSESFKKEALKQVIVWKDWN